LLVTQEKVRISGIYKIDHKPYLKDKMEFLICKKRNFW